jgi:hypothetical protein
VIVAFHSTIAPGFFLGYEKGFDFFKNGYERLANAKGVCS